MRGLQTEYILKGIYLGLLLFLALRLPDWKSLGVVAGFTFGGLAVALFLAGLNKLREGVRIHGQWLAFLIYLVLESPALVYAGVLLGTALGAFYGLPQTEDGVDWGIATAAGGGAALGIGFGALRSVESRTARLGLSLLLGAGVVAALLACFGYFGDLSADFQRYAISLDKLNVPVFAAQLLIGIPIFYLLTFAGKEEESEVEIGAMCAALGVSGWILLRESESLKFIGPAVFLVPVALFFLYTTRVLPGLRVFKHVLRGHSYLRLGRHRLSIQSFRRALHLDRTNSRAHAGLWEVHRTLDLSQVQKDPKLLAMLDLDLCLERAAGVLMNHPTEMQLVEAERLLSLVENQRPDTAPRIHYWRAVARTHARDYDAAAHELQPLLNPQHWTHNDPQRAAVLLPAWQLALTWKDELRHRVGLPQLQQPGRRMEAIVAVERHLADNPDDRSIWDLKRQLYHDLTEEDYDRAAPGAGLAVQPFDHSYCQQMGLALINDPGKWQRGGEYLRIAARGMPATGPSIFVQIAEAHRRAGNLDGARQNFELAKRAGRSVGPKSLADDDRAAYFNTLKLLAEDAEQRGDLDAAIENWHLFTESERSGVETLRKLADLYERKGDPLMALRANEEALIYNGKDPDLLQRKDRYYYSVMPEDLTQRRELVEGCFDRDYATRKARSLLEVRDADPELIVWAEHLARLLTVLLPDGVVGKVLLARCLLRRGEREQAVTILESLRNPKPERFATSDDEEAWHLASRLLGELYLYELDRPDAAIPCFVDYRKSAKSGADTLYKLGLAYERTGDVARAKRHYEQVTAYEGHPLVHDARDALYRLQSGSPSS